jgi:hypothetical protein
LVLRLAVVAPIGDVSPEAHSGAAPLAADLVFEPLLRPDAGGAASRLLRRWERVGPRRWSLTVVEGLRFSDGSPVEPEDVARALREQGLEARADGAGAVEVEARPGAPPVEIALHWAQVARRTASGWLGTGFFAVESQSDTRLVLRRVAAVPGRIASVELIAFPSSRDAFARLLRGEANALVHIDRAQAELLEGVPSLQLVRGMAPNALVVLFGKLAPEDRRALAAALPVGEIGAAALGRECAGAPAAPGGAVPPGRQLRVGYGRYLPEFPRAALALRRALGERGGDIVSLAPADFTARAADLDLSVTTQLVRPRGVAAMYYASGAAWNWSRYSNAAYDAALAAGDEEAASAALAALPPGVVLCRRERIAAVDARLKNVSLGAWGLLDTLPEWEVAP